MQRRGPRAEWDPPGGLLGPAREHTAVAAPTSNKDRVTAAVESYVKSRDLVVEGDRLGQLAVTMGPCRRGDLGDVDRAHGRVQPGRTRDRGRRRLGGTPAVPRRCTTGATSTGTTSRCSSTSPEFASPIDTPSTPWALRSPTPSSSAVRWPGPDQTSTPWPPCATRCRGCLGAAQHRGHDGDHLHVPPTRRRGCRRSALKVDSYTWNPDRPCRRPRVRRDRPQLSKGAVR